MARKKTPRSRLEKWLSMFRRKKRDDGGGWLQIYADMVTLLLCFFVLLYSFSALDNQKFMEFIHSFQGRGILDGGEIVLPGPDTDFPIEEPGDEDEDDDDDPYWADSERLLEHVKQYLVDNDLDGVIRVNKDERGVELQMPNNLLFDPAQARITVQGYDVLEALIPLFADIPNRVLVEGHTDTVPINTTAFPSNWELSAGRSARVVRYFVDENQLDPQRFVVIGYGEYHPQESNSTETGRAANRRVALVIRSN